MGCHNTYLLICNNAYIIIKKKRISAICDHRICKGRNELRRVGARARTKISPFGSIIASKVLSNVRGTSNRACLHGFVDGRPFIFSVGLFQCLCPSLSILLSLYSPLLLSSWGVILWGRTCTVILASWVKDYLSYIVSETKDKTRASGRFWSVLFASQVVH